MPEGEEKEQEFGNLFEKIMKENFPNLMKEINIQVQETQKIPNKMDPKRPTPRHIIIKMPKVKDKERILKAAGEKELVTHRGVPIRLSADFSKETLALAGMAQRMECWPVNQRATASIPSQGTCLSCRPGP